VGGERNGPKSFGQRIMCMQMIWILFGTGSLFELLSTARLPMGKKAACDWLKMGQAWKMYLNGRN